MSDPHPVRRIVTGHDAAGKSTVARDEALALVPGTTEDRRHLAEIWATRSPEEPNGGSSEIRLVELPPGGRRAMHRTDTVDYAIVLAGALTLELDTGDVTLGPGDVVVQRGTSHGWHNRTDRPVRIVFVNLSGQTDDPGRCPDV